MTEKVYVVPKVKLISGTSDDIGYYTWLKSRKEIILAEDKETAFMKTQEFYPDWQNDIPMKFYVGNELVDTYSYQKRVDDMNLQYNNIEYYVFEINGSALFRDLLFNLNMSSSPYWACSNRFLFSILEDDAVEDPKHYHISEEYKDIPEWESQFDSYMEAIKNNRRVDINRLEMPYSISSYFWFGCSRKLLLNILSLLKNSMPFFYEVYGKQMLRAIGTNENPIPIKPDASITQFLRKDGCSEIEGVRKIDDDIYVTSKMALILYSQFIRQASSKVKGLLNLLVHDNALEFQSKVFKGSTTFTINFSGDVDKVRNTVSNRLCAFAMSSGSGPESWSYFLNNFLPENLTPKELMNLLPCKFHTDSSTNKIHLVDCKFYDDIKFRLEGKEVSNCPCPLINLSMDNAEWKRSVDNNKIGNAFYDLTRYLRNGGLNLEYEMTYWTSKLQLYTEKPILNLNEILQWVTSIGNIYPDYSKLDNDVVNTLKPLLKYGLGEDITCMMKGYALDVISTKLLMEGHSSFLITFGGDVFGYNTNAVITIEDTNIDLSLNGNFSVFTSGNTHKRGNHVIGGIEGERTVTVVKWPKNSLNMSNTLIDIISTKHFANEIESVKELKGMIEERVHFIDLDANNKIKNSTYCASPFFNPEQVKVRDNMISNFTNVFRPDLTPSSKEYDNNHNEFADKVVEENIDGIKYTEFLTFPTNTEDLGTLFEVGVALANGHPIIKFDNGLTILFLERPEVPIDKRYIFDCSKKSNAVSMGYVSQFLPKDNIYYQLKGNKDNIMLSVKYTHIEYIDGVPTLIKRDENERDS